MKTLKELKTELLADPQTQAEYEALAGEFEMAHELVAARSRAGLTQGDVAQRIEKGQQTRDDQPLFGDH